MAEIVYTPPLQGSWEIMGYGGALANSQQPRRAEVGWPTAPVQAVTMELEVLRRRTQNPGVGVGAYPTPDYNAAGHPAIGGVWAIAYPSTSFAVGSAGAERRVVPVNPFSSWDFDYIRRSAYTNSDGVTSADNWGPAFAAAGRLWAPSFLDMRAHVRKGTWESFTYGDVAEVDGSFTLELNGYGLGLDVTGRTGRVVYTFERATPFVSDGEWVWVRAVTAPDQNPRAYLSIDGSTWTELTLNTFGGYNKVSVECFHDRGVAADRGIYPGGQSGNPLGDNTTTRAGDIDELLIYDNGTWDGTPPSRLQFNSTNTGTDYVRLGPAGSSFPMWNLETTDQFDIKTHVKLYGTPLTATRGIHTSIDVGGNGNCELSVQWVTGVPFLRLETRTGPTATPSGINTLTLLEPLSSFGSFDSWMWLRATFDTTNGLRLWSSPDGSSWTVQGTQPLGTIGGLPQTELLRGQIIRHFLGRISSAASLYGEVDYHTVADTLGGAPVATLGMESIPSWPTGTTLPAWSSTGSVAGETWTFVGSNVKPMGTYLPATGDLVADFSPQNITYPAQTTWVGDDGKTWRRGMYGAAPTDNVYGTTTSSIVYVTYTFPAPVDPAELRVLFEGGLTAQIATFISDQTALRRLIFATGAGGIYRDGRRHVS